MNRDELIQKHMDKAWNYYQRNPTLDVSRYEHWLHDMDDGALAEYLRYPVALLNTYAELHQQILEREGLISYV